MKGYLFTIPALGLMRLVLAKDRSAADEITMKESDLKYIFIREIGEGQGIIYNPVLFESQPKLYEL